MIALLLALLAGAQDSSLIVVQEAPGYHIGIGPGNVLRPQWGQLRWENSRRVAVGEQARICMYEIGRLGFYVGKSHPDCPRPRGWRASLYPLLISSIVLTAAAAFWRRKRDHADTQPVGHLDNLRVGAPHARRRRRRRR